MKYYIHLAGLYFRNTCSSKYEKTSTASCGLGKSLICCTKYSINRKEQVNNGKATKAIKPIFVCVLMFQQQHTSKLNPT